MARNYASRRRRGALGARCLSALCVSALRLSALAVSQAGCGTLADTGGGDRDAAHAAAGPFRELRREELKNDRVAPYALRNSAAFSRDVSVVDRDGDPRTLPVAAYAAESHVIGADEPDPLAPTTAIVRYLAEDGRSFSRLGEVVLAADASLGQAWIAQPSLVRVGAEWRLYYATGAGIALATSDDGVAFARAAGPPVLGISEAGWDEGMVPSSPSVVALADGALHLFYEAAHQGTTAIGEARSDDGLSWRRTPAPALAPGGATWDERGVGAPFAVLSTSALGRELEWLYHHALASDGRRTIAVAARPLGDDAFDRAPSPVFGTLGSLSPTEPCVVRFDGFSLLFVTERAGKTSVLDYPAVAVGVAPATVSLP